MDQGHFQTVFFKEILDGLVESFAGLTIEANQLIAAATEIYINQANNANNAAVEKMEEETEFFQHPNSEKLVKSFGVIECKKCGHKMGKFIAMDLNYCPGCGRVVKEERR